MVSLLSKVRVGKPTDSFPFWVVIDKKGNKFYLHFPFQNVTSDYAVDSCCAINGIAKEDVLLTVGSVEFKS